MVSICCLTYNHAAYIRECLDGFLIQRTDFPVEIIVHDDASTDDTQDILREYQARYPNRFQLIFQTENQYSKGVNVAIQYIFPRVRSKYIAFCEGDDYWIDPLKLQKQVDFLEKNLDYGLVHTYFNYVDTKDKIIPPPTNLHKHIQERVFDGYIWDYYLTNPGFILTCTCMFRRSLYRYDEQTLLDTGLFMMIARQSKVYCIREITACYRRNPQGAMCSRHNYVKAQNKRVKLYQIYYYINGNPCASFYKNNSSVNKALGLAYVNLVRNLSVLSNGDKMRLLKIIKVKPYILLEIPTAIFKMFMAKVHRGKED